MFQPLCVWALRVYSHCVFGHCVYLVMYRSYLVMHVSLYHGIHDFSALYHCVNSIIALYCCIIALYHCITVSLHCITVQCSAACRGQAGGNADMPAQGRSAACRACRGQAGAHSHALHMPARLGLGRIPPYCACMFASDSQTIVEGTIELS